MSLGTEEQGNEEKSPTSPATDTDGKESTGKVSITLPTFMGVDLLLQRDIPRILSQKGELITNQMTVNSSVSAEQPPYSLHLQQSALQMSCLTFTNSNVVAVCSSWFTIKCFLNHDNIVFFT